MYLVVYTLGNATTHTRTHTYTHTYTPTHTHTTASSCRTCSWAPASCGKLRCWWAGPPRLYLLVSLWSMQTLSCQKVGLRPCWASNLAANIVSARLLSCLIEDIFKTTMRWRDCIVAPSLGCLWSLWSRSGSNISHSNMRKLFRAPFRRSLSRCTWLSPRGKIDEDQTHGVSRKSTKVLSVCLRRW